MAKDILYPLRCLHGRLYEWNLRRKKNRQAYRDVVLPLKRKIKENPDAAILAMTPEHGNLGDHAIATATTDLLRNAGVQWVEVTDQQLFAMRREKCLSVMNGHPVFICGGGNMGTLWMNLETLMREIVRSNPRSPILILPNTVYYENSAWGKQELEKAKKTYNQHQKLHIFAREKTSFEFMENHFRDVELVPDMVLSLTYCAEKKTRSGCILCLRSDLEKTRTAEQEGEIRKQAETLFGGAVSESDMVLPYRIMPGNREEMVKAKLDLFASAQLVITDRLHGMIFCAITGTPCIVVNSKSHKVLGCYEWIRHLDYIRFAEDVSEITALWNQIPKGPHRFDNTGLVPYFKEMEKVVKEYARR